MRVIRWNPAILSVCWGITDAIAQSVEELKLQFPNALLHWYLGASAELADLIWDLIEQ